MFYESPSLPSLWRNNKLCFYYQLKLCFYYSPTWEGCCNAALIVTDLYLEVFYILEFLFTFVKSKGLGMVGSQALLIKRGCWIVVFQCLLFFFFFFSEVGEGEKGYMCLFVCFLNTMGCTQDSWWEVLLDSDRDQLRGQGALSKRELDARGSN